MSESCDRCGGSVVTGSALCRDCVTSVNPAMRERIARYIESKRPRASPQTFALPTEISVDERAGQDSALSMLVGTYGRATARHFSARINWAANAQATVEFRRGYERVWNMVAERILDCFSKGSIEVFVDKDGSVVDLPQIASVLDRLEARR